MFLCLGLYGCLCCGDERERRGQADTFLVLLSDTVKETESAFAPSFFLALIFAYSFSNWDCISASIFMVIQRTINIG
jgi:hypothetical protein